MAIPAVTIEHKLVVKMEGKTPWTPVVKVIGNQQFIHVHKWDRSFTKFMTGKSLDLRAGNNHSIHGTNVGDYLEHLCDLRNIASNNAAIAELSECGSKKRRIQASDSALVPVTSISLPEACLDGVTFEPAKVQVAFAISGTTDLWLEANHETIQRFLVGCKCFQSSNTARKANLKKKVESPKKDPDVESGEKVLAEISHNSLKWQLWSDQQKARYSVLPKASPE